LARSSSSPHQTMWLLVHDTQLQLESNTGMSVLISCGESAIFQSLRQASAHDVDSSAYACGVTSA